MLTPVLHLLGHCPCQRLLWAHSRLLLLLLPCAAAGDWAQASGTAQLLQPKGGTGTASPLAHRHSTPQQQKVVRAATKTKIKHQHRQNDPSYLLCIRTLDLFQNSKFWAGQVRSYFNSALWKMRFYEEFLRIHECLYSNKQFPYFSSLILNQNSMGMV